MNPLELRYIMFDIISSIGGGINKVANDVTTAAETVLPVLGELSLQIAFEYALHATFAARLSCLIFAEMLDREP